MNKERLEQMVTMLRALPPEKHSDFDLSTWQCGTKACAVGHACFDPVFAKQGLRYDECAADPRFGPHLGWTAVERFFEIDSDESTWLFADWRYPSRDDTDPGEVADRISEFIESHEFNTN